MTDYQNAKKYYQSCINSSNLIPAKLSIAWIELVIVPIYKNRGTLHGCTARFGYR